MRIGVYTWGSEGDIRPFYALAHGLQAAGHEVAVSVVAVDGRDYLPLAKSLGLDARAVATKEIAQVRASPNPADDALAGKGHPLKQIQTVLTHLLDPAVDAMWADAEVSLRGCDVAVIHLLHHPAASLALKQRTPIVALQPVPVWPTRALPPMGAPDLGPLNKLLWSVAERVGGAWFLPRVNASRARAGVPLETSMFPRPNPAALTLTCVSPSLVPQPPDWEPSQRIAGFFEVPAAPQGWTPPPALREFLEAGPPPVLMGFGSMLALPTDDTRTCLRVLMDAAQEAGCRALVQGPWELVGDLPAPPHVFRLGRAPHAQVLPHCAAFVHHGGSGTTHTACLAGKPSVVVPFLGDQFSWAARLKALGVAPAAVPRKSLDARKLGKQVRAMLASAEAAAKAAALGAAMAKEDGVAQGVRWVEEVGKR